MENRTVDLRSAFAAGWACFKQHGLWLSLAYLVIGICVGIIAIMTVGYSFVGLLVSAASDTVNGMNAWLVGGSGFVMSLVLMVLVLSLLGLVVEVAMDNLSLGLMSGRFEKLTFDAAKMPMWLYVKAFVVNLLVGLLCTLSLALFVVPFFFIAPRIVFAGLYQLAHPEAGIMESIAASWRMTEGNTLMLLLFLVSMVALSYVGSCIPLVGAVVVKAFFLLCTTAIYYQLDTQQDTHASDDSIRTHQ